VSDFLTKSERSARMSRIRSTNTGPERKIFHLIRRRRVYFARHARTLPGSPDIVFRRCRLAVFIDGDFCHGRNFEKWRSKVSAFWATKIGRNMERDRRARAELEARGWRVLSFWGKDIDRDPESCVERILAIRAAELRLSWQARVPCE